MTHNDLPISDPKLQRTLNSVQATIANAGFAGAVMIVSPGEAAFFYRLHAPWSAIRHDPSLPLGWRIRAKSAEDGKELTEARVLGAAHTICQLSDFGSQTMDWMEQIKTILRNAGIDFDHRPFNGRPLPSVVVGPKEGFPPR